MNEINVTKLPQDLLHTIKLASAKQEQYILKNLSSDEWQLLLSYLKEKNIPSQDKKISRNRSSNRNVVNRRWTLTNLDCVDTIDSVDRNLINDTLDEIRQGHVGYLYYIRYVELLLRYEPDARIDLVDGDFHCRLGR